MGFTLRTAGRAAFRACTVCILVGLAGCEGAFGTSPPHAAPANPTAEGEDGAIVLTWSAVTDATRYAILWAAAPGGQTLENEITGIEGTTYTHTGLPNHTRHWYRIVAETSGGRGPLSNPVSAIPGPVPGAVEWAAVTSQNPGHTIHFPTVANATHYRVYFAAVESQLAGRRPLATFEEYDAPPAVRAAPGVTTAVYYRVIAMNDSRIGTGGPVAIAPVSIISEHTPPVAGAALGFVNDDDCLDLITANGSVDSGVCTSGYTARVLADAGLADLTAAPRVFGDGRLVDVNGDGLDDLFSNTNSAAGSVGSVALLHINQGTGIFQTAASMTALGIGGFGGTVLAADFDNDGDIDVFLPNDQTRGDGARNWFLVNDGSGGFSDRAAAAGLDMNPTGAQYVPNGGQAVDFDEDGFVDLLFGSRLMRNNGDGTFSDASVAAGMPVLADQGLKLADIDLDGDLDLIHHDGAVTRLFVNTDGRFDGGTIVGAEARATVGSGLNACDVNGDGFEDVVVARNDATTGIGTPKFLINVNGSLLPSATQEGTTADPDSLVAENSLLACGDQNGDSMMDVLARWGDSYRLLRTANVLSRRFRIQVVGTGGERNQQGRVVRAVPRSAPARIMTRVVDSGSGLRSQNMYDLVFGAPWTGEYDVTIRYPDGVVTITVEAGDAIRVFPDGTVEDLVPDDET